MFWGTSNFYCIVGGRGCSRIFFFLGGGGSHGFQEEWREAQLSPKRFKRETMENWLSINSQWGECISIWKSLMGESGKFLLWHNKILHSPKTISNNHQPLYKLSYLLNSANSALLFPDGVKRCQIVFVRCIFVLFEYVIKALIGHCLSWAIPPFPHPHVENLQPRKNKNSSTDCEYMKIIYVNCG